MGSSGYQEKINSIAELLIEINKKTINNFDSSKSEDDIKDGYSTTINASLQRYNDVEKDEIADTISSALSKLNDEGKKIALQELESLELYGNTNELIDSNNRVNIAEIRRITVNLVDSTIQDNARHGIDVRAETQGRTKNEPTFAEQIFDLAVATKIIDNFINESKENQDYVLDNMFNLPLEEYNKVQEAVLNIVKKSDKYTTKEKDDFEATIKRSKVLKEPIGNNKYLINEFLNINPPEELVEQLNEMIDDGKDITEINEWIRGIAQQSVIKDFKNHNNEDNSLSAKKDKTVADKLTYAFEIAKLREKISNLYKHNPIDQHLIDVCEQDIKKLEEKNKSLNEQEQKLDATMDFVENSCTKKEKDILQFGSYDITENQMQVIDDLIRAGNKNEVIQQYTEFKKNNFEQMKRITLDVISERPEINLEEAKKLIEEYKFDSTIILSPMNIPKYLKEKGILIEGDLKNVINEKCDKMIKQSNDKENTSDKQKTTEELASLASEELSQMPMAFLKINMPKKDIEDAFGSLAEVLQDKEIVDEISEEGSIEDRIQLLKDNFKQFLRQKDDPPDEGISQETFKMIGIILDAQFHGEMKKWLSSPEEMRKFAYSLSEASKNLSSEDKITDEELSVIVGQLQPEQIQTDAIVEENNPNRNSAKINTEKTEKVVGSTKKGTKETVATTEETLDSKKTDETGIEKSVLETPLDEKETFDKVKQEQDVRMQQDVQVQQIQMQQEQAITQNDEVALVTTNPNSFVNKLKRAWSILTQQKEDNQGNKIGIFKRIKDSLNILTGNENKEEVETKSQSDSTVKSNNVMERYIVNTSNNSLKNDGLHVSTNSVSEKQEKSNEDDGR